MLESAYQMIQSRLREAIDRAEKIRMPAREEAFMKTHPTPLTMPFVEEDDEDDSNE